MASPIVNAITIMLFIGLLAWIIFLGFKFLKRLGFWKAIKFRSLKRKYKDYEFKDNILNWCITANHRGWSYYDVKRFAKYESNKSERLYTFLMISKLTEQELEEFERGFEENEKEYEEFKAVKGEIEEPYREISEGERNSTYFRGGKLSTDRGSPEDTEGN